MDSAVDLTLGINARETEAGIAPDVFSIPRDIELVEVEAGTTAPLTGVDSLMRRVELGDAGTGNVGLLDGDLLLDTGGAA